MISIKKRLAVLKAKRLQRKIWKAASKPITRVIGEWGAAPGSELFPTHSWFSKFLDRVGFSRLKAWIQFKKYHRPWVWFPAEDAGDYAEAFPTEYPTLDNKEWWQVERGLRFNPNLEAKLLHAKTEEEARVIARVHWTSGRGPEAPPQGSGWTS